MNVYVKSKMLCWRRFYLIEFRYMERDLFTVEELGKYLSCSRGFIYSLMKKHKLPHVQLGRRIYFRKKDVDRFMESKLIK